MAVAPLSAPEAGVTVAATLARKAVLVAAEQLGREGSSDADKLERARALLQPPLGAVIAAQAYDLAREVRQACAPSWEVLLKFAALAARVVVVLSLCGARGSMSDIGFESALEEAFERQLGPELRSQLHLARSAICC